MISTQKHIPICCFLFLFISLTGIIPGEEEKADPGKLAYTVMKTAESHKSKGDVYEAGKVFLEAAMIYKKAVAADPGNDGYKTNLKYCLGTRGFIQIKAAQDLMKEKKFGEAAKHFKWAEDAYHYALKELPGENNFQTNLDYAKFHGGTARFEHLLSTKGKAPEITVEGFDGKKFGLADFKGKVILLEFWAGWCPSCKKSMPKLEDLYKEFSGKGLEVIAVAMDRDKTWKRSGSDTKALETSKAHSFRFGWGDESVSRAYGNFNSVPTVILIDKKGNLYGKVAYDDQDPVKLSGMIRSLL